MKFVLVINRTKNIQTITMLDSNTPVNLNPGDSCIIGEYNKSNCYIYSSYIKRGLEIIMTNSSVLEPKLNLNSNESPLPIINNEIEIEEKIKEEIVVPDTITEEKKSSRRSKKSKDTESSESGE